MKRHIEHYKTDTGIRIYRIPVEAFPNFTAYTYLLLGGETPTLVDCGSNMEQSQKDLLAGIQSVHDDFGEPLKVEDIGRILITHGHIDHHGGLSFIRESTDAEVGIHPLDRRILTRYGERVIVASKNLRVYLQRAGVSEKNIKSLMEMYGFAKRLIKSEQVDFNLDEGIELDGMCFYHVPGHCPGQVVIHIGDVLLTADHVLSRITPHQSPESVTHFTGLGHYLESLEKIKGVNGVRLALGGHEEPIHDLYSRIEEIEADHEDKIERVLDIIREAAQPVTIDDISREMYPNMSSYNVLLALEEVGAHVEYLYERGMLEVNNLKEVEEQDNPALRYCVAF